MMKFLLTLLSIAVMAAGFAADPVKLPPKEKFLLVLLAGQSNMAGRGFVQDSDKIPSPRVVMLDKEGKEVDLSALCNEDDPPAYRRRLPRDLRDPDEEEIDRVLGQTAEGENLSDSFLMEHSEINPDEEYSDTDEYEDGPSFNADDIYGDSDSDSDSDSDGGDED